jgi:hypothetical protein
MALSANTTEVKMVRFLLHMLELFGVVFLRFHIVPRLWCVWLVAINAASLLFIEHIEAQAVLLTTAIAVAAQTLIYQRIGFTRILGSTHIAWLPMFAWMATRIDAITAEPALTDWLALLFMTNLVSMIIDLIDAFRYLRGERAPHYRWNLVNKT